MVKLKVRCLHAIIDVEQAIGCLISRPIGFAYGFCRQLSMQLAMTLNYPIGKVRFLSFFSLKYFSLIDQST